MNLQESGKIVEDVWLWRISGGYLELCLTCEELSGGYLEGLWLCEELVGVNYSR